VKKVLEIGSFDVAKKKSCGKWPECETRLSRASSRNRQIAVLEIYFPKKTSVMKGFVQKSASLFEAKF